MNSLMLAAIVAVALCAAVHAQAPDADAAGDEPSPPRRTFASLPSLRSGYTYRNMAFVGGPGVKTVVTSKHQDLANVTFIDCDFSGGQMLVVIEPRRGEGNRPMNAIRNIRFIRCTFRGATGPAMKHSHGVYANSVDGLIFEDCVFEKNGWAVDNEGQTVRWNQNHNVYLSECRNVEMRRCTFIEAASIGIKARGLQGVNVIEDCTFRDNAIAIGTDTREQGGELIVRGCTFDRTGVRAKGHDPLSWTIDAHKLTALTIENCNFGPVAEKATSWAIKINKTVDAAVVRGCDFTRYDGEHKIVNQIGDRLALDGNVGL